MNYTKLTIKINSSDKPPYFVGSQLRGAFGYALKRVVCINPKYDCMTVLHKTHVYFITFMKKKIVFTNIGLILLWLKVVIYLIIIYLIVLQKSYHIF